MWRRKIESLEDLRTLLNDVNSAGEWHAPWVRDFIGARIDFKSDPETAAEQAGKRGCDGEMALHIYPTEGMEGWRHYTCVRERNHPGPCANPYWSLTKDSMTISEGD